MKHFFTGEIISGELSPDKSEFTVTEIKNIHTQSIWNENQLREMYDFLTKVKNSGEDSLIISTGTFPVLINRIEIEKLHQELQAILSNGTV
ncbi:hypothetical protein [Effusibacillus lacus]|uniref:Uncharacterized protein n=1 Tax=Effusibacillus lacus TaxID=1348429 RepID=A0A292YEL4_9BACL|nr:hypothetical protein [Effusibacillus lacus]TCS75886.1 hypothetical protein EDD64_10568 [Effusibacillus lacus]GAX91722.1 hypothetical protein EFBL_3413 [Effusibacillus lacus]